MANLKCWRWLSGRPFVLLRYRWYWRTESSNGCDSHGPADPRNCVGYAAFEISAGNFSSDGKFIDLVKHLAGENQTATLVSSIDPWHAESDRNPNSVQSGLDHLTLCRIGDFAQQWLKFQQVFDVPGDFPGVGPAPQSVPPCFPNTRPFLKAQPRRRAIGLGPPLEAGLIRFSLQASNRDACATPSEGRRFGRGPSAVVRTTPSANSTLSAWAGCTAAALDTGSPSASRTMA